MKNNISPEDILESLKDLKQNLSTIFNRNNSTKTRILLIGPTGSGKTTLMHLISGCKMIAAKIPKNPSYVLQCEGKCNVPQMKIGHTRAAETTLPALHEKNNFLLCDCPGLLDNRSLKQRILNSFSIEQILTHPCNVKILLVLPQSNFETDRGRSAIELFDQCTNFFTNYRQMEQCVGLIITKMSHETNSKEILEYTDFDGLDKHPLLTFFLRHPERCFQIYKPTNSGAYHSNNFKDKERLLTFFQTGGVKNPSHNIILDDNTIHSLCLACGQMNEKMNQYLLQFSHDISEKFRNVKNEEELNNWINIIEKMRFGASQGIESFYDVICKYNMFNSTKQVLEKFILWNLFFNQVVKKTSEITSTKYLFSCNSLIKSLDDQVNELRNRRSSLENQIQLARDQNVISIIQQLNQIVDGCGIVQKHQYYFFSYLEEHPLHYCYIVSTFDPIEFELVEGTNYIIKGKMNIESLEKLTEQMKIILKEVINHFKLVNNNSITDSIINHIETSDDDPDDINEFKKYTSTVRNNAAAYFDGFLHPVKIVACIPVLIGTALKPAFKKKRDKQNIEKMNHWFGNDMRAKKNFVYQNNIAPMLRQYQKIVKLLQQNCPISFSYRPNGYFSFPFEDIHPILPNNSFQFLISQCKSMTDLIETANNRNSMEVFKGIQSIYLRIYGETMQRKINRNGYKLFMSVSRGENIDNALQELSNSLANDKCTDDKIALYSQIIAATRMLGAIHGRGIGSHERKKLFGINTIVNCQNNDGSVRVYCRQNALDINNTIVTCVTDFICDLENTTEENIGSFSPDSFVHTAREYIGKIEINYEKSKENMLDSIENLLQKLNSLINNKYSNSSTKSYKDGKKLLDELKKVEGVTVNNESNNKANVNIKGSTFRVIISSLISIAPEIRKSVTETIRFIKLKSKYDKACSYKPLISFYKHTNSALKNPNIQGIIVKIRCNKLISVEPIMLNHENI